MSKVEELRNKYPKILSTAFNKFVAADTTPTKKYLEYMCIMWTNKNGETFSTKELIEMVLKFDEYLPYIKSLYNTDIYFTSYRRFSHLKKVVEAGIQYKLDKEFVRTDHIDVIIENDEYLLLRPKTHQGSIKYGANTQWCLASKNNKTYFHNYNNSYVIVYLVNKKLSIKENYEKIAFTIEKSGKNPLTRHIDSFNQNNKEVDDITIAESGWGYERLTEITLEIRLLALKDRRITMATDKINRITKFMSTIDLVELQHELNIVNKFDDSFILKTKEVIEEFNKKMEDFLK